MFGRQAQHVRWAALLFALLTCFAAVHAQPNVVAGIVVNPQGEPLADAELFLVAPREGRMPILDFQPEGERYLGGSIYTEDVNEMTTGDDGRFRFEVHEGPASLAVRHATGFTAFTTGGLDDNMRIVIEPWGTLTGRAILNGTPMPGHRVSISANLYESTVHPMIWYHTSTMTDEAGRFTFEDFPSGPADLSLRLEEKRSRDSLLRQIVLIPPGDILEITLGEGGRTIEGTVIVPEGVNAAFTENFVYGNLFRELPTPSDWPPENYDSMSVEQREQWWPAYDRTAEGKARLAEFRDYGIPEIAPDGAFRIQSVIPGEYDLTIVAFDSIDQDNMLGMLRAQVVVPENEDAAQPLDIGIFHLAVNRYVQLQQGDEAPPLAAKTIHGDDLWLPDFRGKYVLLDFWATWCTPCIAQTPNLKAVYQEFRDREDFVMIGLSFDNDPEIAARYAEDHDLDWIQGYLGPWDQTHAHETFGVQGIPRLILVAPDGTIAEPQIYGPTLKSTLEKHLTGE